MKAKPKLMREVIARSQANAWEFAKQEWAFSSCFYNKQQCLCGKPIANVCVLANNKNGNLIEVGNCCARRILGMNTKRVFDGITRVEKDLYASLAPICLHIFSFTLNEASFYKDIWRKIILTPRQALYKLKLNCKALRRVRGKPVYVNVLDVVRAKTLVGGSIKIGFEEPINILYRVGDKVITDSHEGLIDKNRQQFVWLKSGEKVKCFKRMTGEGAAIYWLAQL